MYTSTKGKRNKSPLGLGIISCTLALATYFIVKRVEPSAPIPVTTNPLNKDINKPEKSNIGPPVRITIPKINVDAVLEYVGVDADGEMEEPTEPGNAAWYNSRPLPGEVGSSVIAGHFGFKDNKPAVFDDLDKLRIGDEIYVKDSKGVNIAFVVQDLRTYHPEQDATDVFGSNDGKSHLNLITCKGAWNESLQSYDSRLVVFAERNAL